ncbi:Alpha/Beta hydrolase protein [Hysterangium stoloniferum]|nr:Alpha/Beta hydrolase protein [Hysterangium stoloniferum]
MPALTRANRSISSPYPRASSLAAVPDELRDQLNALHADELAYLSQQWRRRSVPKVVSNSYTYLFCRTSRRYFKYLWQTWTRALWGTFFLPTTFFDRLSIAAFALVSSWIVFFLFVWCLLANHPIFIRSFKYWSNKRAKGFSLINAAYPGMFEELTHEQLQAAGAALAKPIHGTPNTSTTRIFNLDIAKLLLQCSALMYERTSAPLQDALETSARMPHHRQTRQRANSFSAKPGALLSAILGPDAASEVNRHLHANPEEDALAAFAHRLGLRYNTVSELNSQASAFCGMFWDPESTWIILAYKGTSPTEFVEWTTDFSFTPRDVGHWIRGWGRAHGGFVDKIFPRKIKPGARLPYDTIRQAVKTVSRHLLANKPEGTEINVWTTGHSLGCALASLVYARQINEPRDLGHNVVVRDAYLFAAPILCDVDSVNAFNNRMNHGADSPRTMWRITNGLDVVARSLPNFGDYSEWSLSPYNLFSYAHIGAEIQLKRSPECSIVGGETHITPGSHIRIVSTLMANVTLLGSDAESRKAQAQVVWAQKLPLIGRILAHGTASYWIALNEVRTGRVEWEDS